MSTEWNTVGTSKDEAPSETDVDTDVLAKPRQEMQVQIDMSELLEYTYRPSRNILQLPVKYLSTADKNDRMVLKVDHPVEDIPPFRLHKPKVWDVENEELPRLLNSYGYGPGNMYHIQTDKVFVQYDDEWKLLTPEEAKLTEADLRPPIWRRVSIPETSLGAVFVIALQFVGLVYMVLTHIAQAELFVVVIVSIITFFAGGMIAAGLVPPPEEEE